MLHLDLFFPFLLNGDVLFWGRDGNHDGPFIFTAYPMTSLHLECLGIFAACGLLRGSDG